MHIYRWDLDRTYLDTEIDSVRGLLRTALESAGEKKVIPGADALLRSLIRHDPDAMVCILSGSPRQMRGVLREKLALDGICLLYTSPSPRDLSTSRMPSSA